MSRQLNKHGAKVMKTTIELTNGYELRISTDGEYYRIFKNNELIYSDSANEDMYNEETATDFALIFINER